MTNKKGLLNSGTTHNFIDIRTIIRLGIGTRRLKKPRTVTNFIDIRTIIRLGIGTRRLKKPRTVTNVDETTNRARRINRYTNLQFNYNRKTEDLSVFVTNLGRDRIILGLLWFQKLNPTISWKQGELLGELTVKTSSKVLEINKTTLATSWAIQEEADKT
jgi:hypothetical protein